MTGRTHDLAAFTGLTMAMALSEPTTMTVGTALVAFTANMVGGLAPDLDNATALLWKRIRGGAVLGKLLAPLLGGHRLISHSLIGLWLFILAANVLGRWLETFVTVDFGLVWWAFVIGLVSHLIMDGVTKDGIPLLFPLPFSFGFPPLKRLRMRTGGWLENFIVFPGLILLNGYIITSQYDHFVEWVKLLAK